ncbi:MAG: RidA family protein [Phycisphaerae bacterium]|nr:RidA family protein [Phycisphaerae bacterium]
MSAGQEFISKRGPEPVGPYPHARRVGDLLFISGIGPRRRGEKSIPGVRMDAAGNVIDYDIAEQCKAVFENIRWIIEDAGAKWENIVDVTSFLTNMERDFAGYNQVYEAYLGTVRPTRTTVEVRALPTKINVELKVIVWMGGA